MADQISDGVLDEVLSQDPSGRVACETMITTGMVVIAGEISCKATLDFNRIARSVIEHIGYTDPAYGFDFENCAVLSAVDPQSPDIAMGVDTGGAGDQGLMFGYASRETAELMPLPIQLAHGLTRRLAEVRRSGELPFLRPDGKAQVTVEYDREHRPVGVHTVVVSTQHDPDISTADLKTLVRQKVIAPAMPEGMLDDETIVHVNPTGRFVTGGPKGDCGLTGRKIIVDTYGGVGSHGGGASRGKGPHQGRPFGQPWRATWPRTSRRRSGRPGAGAARHAIGVADPVSVHVNSYGTGAVSDRVLEALVWSTSLDPAGDCHPHLDPLRPIYRATRWPPTDTSAVRSRSSPGERSDRAESLRAAAALAGELPAVSTAV
ncbi:MAG: methionine adenosyltransferase [Thermoanaerobaculia bacterium]